MGTLEPFIQRAAEYVNSLSSNHELECLSTITYLLKEKEELSQEEIVDEFNYWSEDKAKRFSEEEIINGIDKLFETDIIEKL